MGNHTGLEGSEGLGEYYQKIRLKLRVSTVK